MHYVFLDNITEAEVITAFVKGLHHCDLRTKINHNPSKGIGEIITTADQYADAEEAELRFNEDVGTHHPTRRSDERPDERRHNDRRYDDCGHHQDSGRDRPEGSKADQYRRCRLDNIVATIDEPRAKCNYNEQYKKILEGPCPLHKNSNHKMKDYLGLAKEFQAKKKDDDNDDGARGR